MPSKKKDELSHQEIWDDSALIQSWDEALEEYKVRTTDHSNKCINTDEIWTALP